MTDGDFAFAFEPLPNSEMIEIAKSFGALAEHFTMSPDTAQGKVVKRHRAGADEQAVAQRSDPSSVNKLTRQMAALLLHHDRLLNSLQAQDSFILYMSKEKASALHVLLEQGNLWHQQREQGTLNCNLRTHLMRTLLQELLQRVESVSKANAQAPLWQTCVARNLITQDGGWMFHKWNQAAQTLEPSAQPPMPMKSMLQTCEDLVEQATNSTWIVKFHSLRTDPKSLQCPWRLQVNLRMDEGFHLLHRMCASQAWCLLGISLKPHTQTQSPQATALQQTLNMGMGKGKGKTSFKPMQKGKVQPMP